ncbi:hypothetical protein [Jiella mangrovi]|uniref:Uncharacterized protein n=1 Tax=Jiella mangrovi TaxID=2821407 RepID=A0ABS4BNI7_9HYPH|nr:hypothetical protein [Jiella mangrovi]MBP0618269.1 hypothetical protein [Jiella mangrovi]
MKHFVLAGMLSLSAATSVLAQAPDANTQAILDALKGINNRLDTIEGRIDTIEGSGTAAGQASAAGGKNPPQGMEAKDGWDASAHMVTNGTVNPDALVYFTLPPSEIRLNAHMAKTKSSSVMAYDAEAKFNAFEDGRYLFVIETGGRAHNIGCSGGLSLGPQQVIAIGTPTSPAFVSDGLTLTGSADLTAGNYDITFTALCQKASRGGYSRPIPTDASWRDTGFRILVRGPNERDLRPLTDKELFHYEQTAKLP